MSRESQIANPPRIAHCIVGSATLSRGGYSRPIWHPYAWRALQQWLHQLEALGVNSDVFFVLDMTKYPPKGTNSSCGHCPLWKQLAREEFPSPDALGQLDLSLMNRSLEALKPVSFQIWQPGACSRFTRERMSCACTVGWNGASYPRFYEQVAKNAACLAAVEARERSLGFRYTHLTKLRPDANLAAEAASPEWLAASIMHPAASNVHPSASEVVHIQPWRNAQCYAGSDWFALVPRSFARLYFNFTAEVSCKWMECVAAQYYRLRMRSLPAARFAGGNGGGGGGGGGGDAAVKMR
uniref:Uncharacterized protein n=1 Tax=Chrysotila carterae TaxID=13221 RepID=A0A7S4BB22_CHRCT